MSQLAKHYDLAKHHAHVGRSYDTSELVGVRYGFDFERERLEKHAPVEYAITQRYLLRYVPADATVVDIGVGVGHYSEYLARRGCKVHLVDVAQRLLVAAQERLTEAGLKQQILSITHASATDLSFISDESCDAVLMLGPLYHLSLPAERRQAVSEAHRVLREGGLLLAAGINRMTILRWIYWDGPEDILEEKEWLQMYVKTGELPSPEAGMPTTGYLTTIADFRAEFTDFQEIGLVGIESFAQGKEETLLTLSPEKAQIWLDLIEETGRTPEGLGMTGHFLFIGRK